MNELISWWKRITRFVHITKTVRVYFSAWPESLNIILVNFLLQQLKSVLSTTFLNVAISFFSIVIIWGKTKHSCLESQFHKKLKEYCRMISTHTLMCVHPKNQMIIVSGRQPKKTAMTKQHVLLVSSAFEEWLKNCSKYSLKYFILTESGDLWTTERRRVGYIAEQLCK